MELETIKKYNNNCKLWTEHSYLKGVQYGRQKLFYENKKIKCEYYIINKLYNKIYQEWFYDGTRQYIHCYKNSAMNGPKLKFNY